RHLVDDAVAGGAKSRNDAEYEQDDEESPLEGEDPIFFFPGRSKELFEIHGLTRENARIVSLPTLTRTPAPTLLLASTKGTSRSRSTSKSRILGRLEACPTSTTNRRPLRPAGQRGPRSGHSRCRSLRRP